MQFGEKENTIILKELESNIVSEAVIVLKPGVKLRQNEFNLKNKSTLSKSNSENIVILEAQKTINEYISEIEQKQSQRDIRRLRKKYAISKMFNFALIICIAIIIEILS